MCMVVGRIMSNLGLADLREVPHVCIYSYHELSRLMQNLIP